MSKLKIIAAAIAIIFLIVIMFGIALLTTAVAGSAEIKEQKIQLFVEKGEVFYKFADQEYTSANNELELQAGAYVKTEPGAQARIVFYDTQEIILDENSEIKISQALLSQSVPFLTKIKVVLYEGQAWSRLLELLHPEAAFEVEADNIVATVRGTSFNVLLLEDDIEVAVFENQVLVTDSEDFANAITLQENAMLSFKRQHAKTAGAKFSIRKIQQEDLQSNWIKNNLARDQKFKKQLRQQHDKQLARAGVLPDSKLYKLKKFGEKIQALFLWQQEQKDKFAQNLKFKRLLEAEGLARRGKIEQAVLQIKEFKTQQTWLQLQQFKKLNPELKQSLAEDDLQKKYFWNIFLADASAYQKQFLEQKIAQAKAAETTHKEVAVEQAEPADSGGQVAPANKEDSAGQENKSILQKLKNLTAPLPEDVSGAAETTLPAGQAAALQADESPTDKNLSASAPAEPIAKSLTILSSRKNMAPGDFATLSAVLEMSDGSQQDVTAQVEWTVGADDLTGRMAGKMTRNIFQASNDSGKAYITAQLNDLTGKITLTVLALE